jgi:myosin heavy subunit
LKKSSIVPFAYRLPSFSTQKQPLSADIVSAFISRSLFEFGSTRIFLKSEAHNRLEQLRRDRLNEQALLIQKNWRKFIKHKQWNEMRVAAAKIQSSKIKHGIEHVKKKQNVIHSSSSSFSHYRHRLAPLSYTT